MELSIAGQALSLLCFACMGLALGLLYDLLRPMRYRGRAAFLLDFAFCAAGAGACFALCMESGKPGLWNLMLALLSFCLYIRHLSPLLLPLILEISAFFASLAHGISNRLTNLKFLKKHLYK